MNGSDGYLEPYREAAEIVGAQFAVTLWTNPEAQRKRFDVFTQMCFLAGKRLLDAGCSRGDMAAYLLERDIAFDHYVGVDALENVITFAAQRQLPRCEFVFGDFVADPTLLRLGRPQVICISGSLNTMSDRQARYVLEQAWQATSETLLFNFLSDRTDPAIKRAPLGQARRMNCLALLDWAMGHTTHVAFRQDYFAGGHDATILMRKPTA